MIKSILSLISFIGMTVLAYYTVRTFAFVTSVFAILAIITMVSAVLVGKSGKLMNFLFEDLEDLPRGTRLSLTTIPICYHALCSKLRYRVYPYHCCYNLCKWTYSIRIGMFLILTRCFNDI